MTIQDAGLYLGSDYVNGASSLGGDGVGPKYTNWDFASIGVCNCDMGFFGPDCSRRMCPKADDPVTINQNERSVMVSVQSDGTDTAGKVLVSFLGHTAEFSLTTAVSNTYCEQQWELLDNINDVTCLVTDGPGHTMFNVTFHSFPSFPSENNFFSHTGNPAVTDFTCDTSQITVTGGTGAKTCRVKDITNTDIKEYEFCGRRGTCDFTSGLCYCFQGYGGLNCNSASYSSSASNAEAALAATAVGNDYSGNVLELQTEKPNSPDFKFLSCKADGEWFLLMFLLTGVAITHME